MLAGRLGQGGLQRVHRVDQQRETALALQHAILGPSDIPSGFAVRYQAASRPLQVGGDWYDIVSLDDGRIALVVGDCVGHGLPAATVMGADPQRLPCVALRESQSCSRIGGSGSFRGSIARRPLHHGGVCGAHPPGHR